MAVCHASSAERQSGGSGTGGAPQTPHSHLTDDVWVSVGRSCVCDVIIARARLTGTVEFRELPRNLQELNLFGNNLTGPLFLCMLPSNIRMLNFVSNEIHQDHLFYGDLPVALESVFIDRGSGTLKSLEKGELSKQREAIFHRL